MINRVFLIGFRTTGKSTFGKILAESLGLSFFEMDFLIKEQAGQELDQLTKNGTDWVKFREIENEVLGELIKTQNAIISCGGGVGVNDVVEKSSGKTFGQLNREVLENSKDSLIILLTSADEDIKKRLRGKFIKKKIMPFLNKQNTSLDGQDLVEAQVEDSMEAYKKRRKLYEELADFEIDTSKFKFPERLANINVSIGDPIKHSLSPAMHSSGYKALGIENSNLLIACRVKAEKLEKFIEAVKTIGINGVSVTLPHKQEVMKYLDEIDATAKKIGAVNTILNKAGKLTGYNTDWTGAILALEKKTDLKNKKVAVIGAGGAARAIVFGLVKKGAKAKIFNRTLGKAKGLARDLGGEVGEKDEMGEIRDYDVVINTTSVGMDEDISPLPKDLINKKQIVFDVVYSPKETRLLRDAKEKEAQIVYGYEMLLYQGVEQFKMYTGLNAPVKEMEEVLLNNL